MNDIDVACNASRFLLETIGIAGVSNLYKSHSTANELLSRRLYHLWDISRRSESRLSFFKLLRGPAQSLPVAICVFAARLLSWPAKACSTYGLATVRTYWRFDSW
jgi:hypothetical protein